MSAKEVDRESKSVNKLNDDVDAKLKFYLSESLSEAVAQMEQEFKATTSVEDTNSGDDLEQLLQMTAETFSEKLVSLVEEKNITVSLLCRRSGIERRHFSKMKHNRYYRPTKNTVMALAIGLRLSYTETEDFMKHAGYVLTKSSKKDLIIEYCLRNSIYAIDDVNALLYKYTGNALIE